MALGLFSRSDIISLPNFLTAYSGDTLWALMVYWCVRVLLPTQTVFVSASLALAFSFGIESLQLYQAPWINSIRMTKIGGLVLGYGFLFSDLACYIVGVTFGALLNKYFLLRTE